MWEILGAVVTAIGGLITAGITANNSKKLQQSLLEQQYSYNSELQEDEQEYNEEMMKAEMEYNSASAQRTRYEQAGLNPYMMMGGGSAGTVQAASSGSNSVGLPSADIGGTTSAMSNAVTNGLSNVIDAIRATYEQKQADALTEGADIENAYKAATLSAEISNTAADTELKKEQTKEAGARTYYEKAQGDLANGQAFLQNYLNGLPSYLHGKAYEMETLNQFRAAQTQQQIALTQTENALRNTMRVYYQSGAEKQRSEANYYAMQTQLIDYMSEVWQSAEYRKAIIEAQVAQGAIDKGTAEVVTRTIDEQVQFYNAELQKALAQGEYARAQEFMGILGRLLGGAGVAAGGAAAILKAAK